jgi:mono/diheme cytochrome c family protein
MKVTHLLVVLAVFAAGCDIDDWGPSYLGKGQHASQQAFQERGRLGYATYCVGCHGEKGDGNGPAARFMNPKPRDFRVGRLKYTSAPAGSPPSDADYFAALRHGLSATAMPSWALVPERDLQAIVAYVKTFYPGWKDDAPVPPLAIPEDPFREKPAAGIAEGERVYHGIASCIGCHAAYVPREKITAAMKSFEMSTDDPIRPDVYEAIPKDSDWGAQIRPPDFLFERTKMATTREELVKVIATGVGGTAMPSWGSGGLTPEQLWGLGYYVESLVAIRGTPQATELHRSLLTPAPAPK